MSTEQDLITYECCCDRHTITALRNLYYCMACQDTGNPLRCLSCVTEEIDSYHCPNCLENWPSSEAMQYRNRCPKCFDCPTCGNSLTTVAHPTDGTHLHCKFCRWNSVTELGVSAETPKELAAQLFKHETTSEADLAVNDLLKKFQSEAATFTQEKERDSRRTRGRFFSLSATREQSGARPRVSVADVIDSEDKKTESLIVRPPSPQEVLPADDAVLAATGNTQQMTSLAQRHRCPAVQAEDSRKAYPSRKGMLTKRSRRCRKCARNVIKPELNPRVVTFKMQFVALAYVPDLEIVSGGDLSTDGLDIQLTWSNPLDTDQTVKVSDLEPFNADALSCEFGPSGSGKTSFEVELDAVDDLAGFDDDAGQGDNRTEADDKDVIVARRLHTVTTTMHVKRVGDVQAAAVYGLRFAMQVEHIADSGKTVTLTTKVSVTLDDAHFPRV